MNPKQNTWIINALNNPRVTWLVVAALAFIVAPEQIAGFLEALLPVLQGAQDAAEGIDTDSMPVDGSLVQKIGWVLGGTAMTQTRQGNVSSARMRDKLPDGKMKDI